MSGIDAKVGGFYLVPCMYVSEGVRTSWMPTDWWVPVLGPRHDDAEHLNLAVEHYHVDWRFIPDDAFHWAGDYSRTALGNVLSMTDRSGLHGTPVLKRRKCRRLMPTFPAITQGLSGTRWLSLEEAQTKACVRLKPGNICPHRGIDLTPFVDADGTAVCPGHGLKWNLRTGELVPRHGPARLQHGSEKK